MIFERTKLLIGQENIQKLKDSHVCIFGIGGVGGYVAEGLARAGIGSLSLVDYDVVDISNINRQIIATLNTIGKNKVDVMEERLLLINSELSIIKYNSMLTNDNISLFFNNANYTYVADAIDMVSSKIDLIEYCILNNVNIISSMGTGKKIRPEKLEISDISKTSVCPLAKVIRKELKKRNIYHLNVVFSTENPIDIFSKEKKGEKNIGSISFVPSIAGMLMASKIVNDIISLN
ncbi:tRNA threonylcarbamoyladenosine dehydratase [Fusobacterium sp. PH5-44]|uniref:tRNA threonylcarbamoyladenosine dehydratase n=1 Tax=unclassified Fusobacterium TaxID=2648384 RepID=UPI003D262DFA